MTRIIICSLALVSLLSGSVSIAVACATCCGATTCNTDCIDVPDSNPAEPDNSYSKRTVGVSGARSCVSSSAWYDVGKKCNTLSDPNGEKCGVEQHYH